MPFMYLIKNELDGMGGLTKSSLSEMLETLVESCPQLIGYQRLLGMVL